MYRRLISLEETIQIWDFKLKDLKVVTNGHHYTKKYMKMKKYIFWIKAHIWIRKQSNKDSNTSPSIKKNIDPYIKVPLFFLFLIMTFNVCFYYQFSVKWVCINFETALEILSKLLYSFQNVCGCLILDEILIKLTSLILCSINDNITNTST